MKNYRLHTRRTKLTKFNNSNKTRGFDSVSSTFNNHQWQIVRFTIRWTFVALNGTKVSKRGRDRLVTLNNSVSKNLERATVNCRKLIAKKTGTDCSPRKGGGEREGSAEGFTAPCVCIHPLVAITNFSKEGTSAGVSATAPACTHAQTADAGCFSLEFIIPGR